MASFRCDVVRTLLFQASYACDPLLRLPLPPRICSLEAVVRMVCKKPAQGEEIPPHKWLLVGCSSPFMRLAEYLTAVRFALGARDDVCLGKTQRAPYHTGIVGMRGSYRYGHTTTDMHEYRVHPRPAPPPPLTSPMVLRIPPPPPPLDLTTHAAVAVHQMLFFLELLT